MRSEYARLPWYGRGSDLNENMLNLLYYLYLPRVGTTCHVTSYDRLYLEHSIIGIQTSYSVIRPFEVCGRAVDGQGRARPAAGMNEHLCIYCTIPVTRGRLACIPCYLVHHFGIT